MAVVLESPAPKSSSIDPASLATVLAEVAETASETLELQQVFDRVSTSVRQVMPFENMGVVRIEGERSVVHATTVRRARRRTSSARSPEPLTAWSPRIRPRPGPIRRD